MKLALSLTLSFLLFAFVTKLPLAFSNDVEPVLDTNGNPICPDGKYYIIPAIQPGGGGLRLGNTSDSECALIVLQDYSEAVNGIPVRFSKPGTSCPCFISTDTPLEIEFIEKPNCAESSKWLLFFDPLIGKFCLGIGSPPGMPITGGGLFSILKYGSGYTLAECDPCIYYGRLDKFEGGRRLCFGVDEPFEFVLVDAASYDKGLIRSVA